MKIALNIIKKSIYYIILLFLVFFIIVTIFIPNGLIKVFGVGWYRVVSASMEDLIMTNDYIIVTPTDINSLEDGDIIVFTTYIREPSSFNIISTVVTHHFGYIDDDGHIMTYRHEFYGSDQIEYDKWFDPNGSEFFVTEDNVIGEVRHIIRTAQLINSTKQITASPIFWVLGIFVISTGVVIYVTVKKNKDKETTSNDGDDSSNE